MRIAQVDVFGLTLPMRRTFTIAGGVVGNEQAGAPHVYVRITDEDGLAGWGEARPSPRWSYETQETVISTIERYLRPTLLGQPVDDLRSLGQRLDREIAAGATIGQPIAKAAVDTALHDLIGQRRGQSIGELWNARRASSVQLSYLISERDPMVAAKMAQTAVEEGYLGLDVKIGFDAKRDIDLVTAVKSAAPHLFLRVDANQGYNLAQALQVASALGRIGADVFEQPLPASALIDLASLRRKSPVPLALDESIWSPRDLLAAIRLEACDYVVIKLTKMGGMRAARLCGEMALAANLGLLGGGLTESRLGLAASVQLFDYLGIVAPVDLNGPMFLADDPLVVGPQVEGPSVTLSALPGVGCQVDDEKLRALRWKG